MPAICTLAQFLRVARLARSDWRPNLGLTIAETRERLGPDRAEIPAAARTLRDE